VKYATAVPLKPAALLRSADEEGFVPYAPTGSVQPRNF